MIITSVQCDGCKARFEGDLAILIDASGDVFKVTYIANTWQDRRLDFCNTDCLVAFVKAIPPRR